MKVYRRLLIAALTLTMVLRYYGFVEAPPIPVPAPQPQQATVTGDPLAFLDNPYRDDVAYAAALYGVHPRLLDAVIRVESDYQPRAVSLKGARGLMQLMPGTAQRLGVDDVFDARENVLAGARYLRFLLDTFDGNVTLALAAYNAGENAVLRYRGVPPYRETRDYVRRIALALDEPTGRRAGARFP